MGKEEVVEVIKIEIKAKGYLTEEYFYCNCKNCDESKICDNCRMYED